ncbi:MAG: STM4015 family protein [Saprospiraceae bacterium]
MKAELIYQDETSNKFWKINVTDNKHTVTYGRVGSDGTSKTKEFSDSEAALKDATKLMAAKKKKGYVDTSTKATIVRDPFTLAGKPIAEFASTFNPATAVKVTSGYEEKFSVVDKLDKLSNLSNIAEMDTLVIGAWQESWETNGDAILKKLIEFKNKFSGLKHLFIADMDMEECEMSWINQSDYTNFYEHFPALETFGVKGGQSLIMGEIKLPNLKNLIIETGGLDKKVVLDIAKSYLPNLEHLEIWLGTEDYGGTVEVNDLQGILKGNYPKLKYLGLKNYDEQDVLAKGLQGATILQNIEVLDLSMGILKDEGAEALYNNDALLKLKHLNCRHHFISKDWQNKLKTKFSAQNINLEDEEDSEDGEYYFVEIGE